MSHSHAHPAAIWARQLRYALASGRPVTSSLAAFATAYPALAGARHPGPQTLPAILLAASSMALVTAAGFILNDVADYHKDRVAQKGRPVSLGLLPRPIAVCYAVVALAAALAMALPFATPRSLGILAATILLVTSYSSASRHIPLLKNLYVVILCILPIIYGQLWIGRPLQFTWLFPLSAFIAAREILLDSHDYSTDTAYGVVTLAGRLGQQSSELLGWAGMFLASIIAALAADNTPARLAFGLTAVVVLIAQRLYPTRSSRSLAITRLALLTGILGLGAALK